MTFEKDEPTFVLEPGTAPDGSSTAPLLSVVIPVYNEEGIIVSSVMSLREHLGELGFSFEILLAENGSVDRTVELANELSAKYEEVDYFSIGEPNYGRALKEGILRARGFSTAPPRRRWKVTPCSEASGPRIRSTHAAGSPSRASPNPSRRARAW